jgi:hypothetical protein
MNSPQRIDYLTRDGVLKLLSDDEIASVSNAESAEHLAEGDEYLDLEHLDEGVHKADGMLVVVRRVLPKKAVHEQTWSKILAVVAAARQRDSI